MKVGIKEIAQRTGASYTTVSHVLNGTRFVSEAVRQKVLAAVQELGYQPNAVARGLRTSRSKTLGLILSDMGGPFFIGVSRAVEERARALGYAVIVAHSAEHPEREEESLRLLVQHRVDGILLSPTADAKHPGVDWVIGQKVPLITLNRFIRGIELPSVLHADEQLAHEATCHLIDHGYDRIAAVTGAPGMTTSESRLKGYLRALREHGREPDPNLIVCGGGEFNQSYAAVKELLLGPHRPRALFVFGDRMTLGAIRAIRHVGLRCPEDVAIIGQGEFEASDILTPALSLVSLPYEEMGARAVDLIVKCMGEEGKQDQVVIPGRLVLRESCGCKLSN